MADRRPLNPRLVRALREAAVPPLDYITDDTKVVEVPYPAPQQPQQPPVEAQPQQQQAPAAPKSRFDIVREYLERTGGSASPPAGVLPDEVDLRAAEEADALASTRAGLQAAAAAFLGDRKAAFQDTASTRNVDRARALQAQRSKALADWVASQERRRMGEAQMMAQAAPIDPEGDRMQRETEARRAAAYERSIGVNERLGESRDERENRKVDAQLERDRKRGAGAGGKAAEKVAAAEAKAKAAGFKTAMDLRKEFNSLPEVKDFKDVDVAFRKIQSATQNVSAAGDLSLIFGYMKMLDPGSTVREGEFANAQNAGGVDDRVSAAYNKVKEGQRLSESQRRDFLAQAQGVYGAQRSRFQESADMYRALAQKGGLDPDDVVGGVKKKDEPPPAAMVRVRRKSDGVVKSLPKSTADKLGDGFEVLP